MFGNIGIEEVLWWLLLFTFGKIIYLWKKGEIVDKKKFREVFNEVYDGTKLQRN